MTERITARAREVCGGMTPRWMVERKAINRERELLQVVEVYAVGENKETVKAENRKWTHKRRLLLIDAQ